MKKIVTTTALLITSIVARARSSTELDEDCKVQAWVRAEDLAPDHISHGDLRIKVKPAHCANRIASVALRLQLDEFGDVKYLRRGAVLPEIHISNNQTVPMDVFGFFGGNSNDVVYDYSAYDRAISDSAFWVVKGEERRAWSTEVVLFQNNPNFSKPMVAPFTVASPAVNYPPALSKNHAFSHDPIRRHASSQLGYHYIAMVEFVNGTTVDIPAGHTDFVPTSPPSPARVPVTWNVTFTEDKPQEVDLPSAKKESANMQRCLPEELRSVFVAEVTLYEGNSIRPGQMLRGKVTVHATPGSTTMSDLEITLMTTTDHHWATAQATTGGDDEFGLFSRRLGRHSTGRSVNDSYIHAHLFKEKDDDSEYSRLLFSDMYPSHHSRLTATKPYFDFEIQVPQTVVPDFSAFYGSVENFLGLQLKVSYSRDAEICIRGVDACGIDAVDDESTADDLEKTEDGLWDPYTRVGQPPIAQTNWARILFLTGQVRINVLGDMSTQRVDHYLKSGLPSPVILASQEDIVFPPAHPVTIVEPIANTSARLMDPEGTFDPFQSSLNSHNRTRRRLAHKHRFHDPLSRHGWGNYVGLLWKKKVVAMERGILPLEVAQASQDETNGQHSFVVAP